MEFQSSRGEFRVDKDCLEDLVDSNDQTITHSLYFCIKLLKVVKKNTLLDSNDGVVSRIAHGNCRKETLTSVGHFS